MALPAEEEEEEEEEEGALSLSLSLPLSLDEEKGAWETRLPPPSSTTFHSA